MQMWLECLERIARAGLNKQSLKKNELHLLQADKLDGAMFQLTS